MHDDVIMRTIVDLPAQQVAALGEFCEREQISRAEAIRRAVAALLASQSQATWESTFGTWSPRGDSREAVDELRKDWDPVVGQ
jgi:hypothetical protein